MIYTVFAENLAGLLFPEFLLEKIGALHVSLEGFNVPDKWGKFKSNIICDLGIRLNNLSHLIRYKLCLHLHQKQSKRLGCPTFDLRIISIYRARISYLDISHKLVTNSRHQGGCVSQFVLSSASYWAQHSPQTPIISLQSVVIPFFVCSWSAFPLQSKRRKRD